MTATGAISRKEINHAEREFMVDSGASVRMMSKSDIVHEGQTASRVHVRDLDMCVIVQLLDDAPAVLSRGNVCEVFKGIVLDML